MGVVTLNNAVGIDEKINTIQQCLIDNLVAGTKCGAPWNSDSLEIYHKAYKNPTPLGVVPEVFTQNNDYEEALLNDTKTSTVFFTVEDAPTALSKKLTSAVVSIFFQLNIEDIYEFFSCEEIQLFDKSYFFLV